MVSYEGAKDTAKYLVHWENPPASAGVLSAILAVLVSICYFSFIAVIAYISLAILFVIMGIKIYSFAMVFMKKVVFSFSLNTVFYLLLLCCLQQNCDLSNCHFFLKFIISFSILDS